MIRFTSLFAIPGSAFSMAYIPQGYSTTPYALVLYPWIPEPVRNYALLKVIIL